MKNKQKSMVCMDNFKIGPMPDTVSDDNLENLNHGNFSASPPIYPNYCEKLEIFNSENLTNHGKSAIWVEREDFYRVAVNPPLNTNGDDNSIKPKKRKLTMSSDPYLLIGFDTEYKSPDEAVTRKGVALGEAKYRVLSYQFHAKTSDEQEWTGICCPEGEERLTLSEFLVFVLGSGARFHGVKNLPMAFPQISRQIMMSKTEMEKRKCSARNMPLSSKMRQSNKSSTRATRLSM